MDVTSGYATVGDLEMWRESRGSSPDGVPLVVVHGGFGLASMFGDLLDELAGSRQVVAVELQGHGHTPDIDRAFSWDAFGDDLAGFAAAMGFAQVDLMGYSLGGTASLRAAIRHPAFVRRLVLVSIPCKREGWHPEVQTGMTTVNSSLFEGFRQSPMYAAYAAVAPDVSAYPMLMDRTGALISQPYDWSDDVRGLPMPVLLVYGDADSVPPSHAAEFYALLGGGLRDAGWDMSGRGTNRLAILPGVTHYDSFVSPRLVPVVDEFLR